MLNRAANYWMFLWPGLPRLWREGNGYALAAAVTFSVLFNTALFATLIFPGVLTPTALSTLWLGTIGFWAISAWNSHQWVIRTRRLSKKPGADQWFPQAQAEYLKGHWLEAERLLKQQLDQHESDVDAHLLLATVYRRSNRRADAIHQLELLSRFERAGKWWLEIEQEKQLLQRIEENDETETNRKVA